jgi:hypothetical protein
MQSAQNVLNPLIPFLQASTTGQIDDRKNTLTTNACEHHIHLSGYCSLRFHTILLRRSNEVKGHIFFRYSSFSV